MSQVNTKEIPEVKSLRWLANMFPKFDKPQDDSEKLSTCIHLYCTAGANLLEDYRKKIEFLTDEYHKMRANRDSMVDINTKMSYRNTQRNTVAQFYLLLLYRLFWLICHPT